MSNKSSKKRKIKFNDEGRAGLLMVLPPVMGFLLFGLIPILISFGLSFVTLNSYDIAESVFCGFDNFTFILKDDRFWRSIKNTLTYAINMPICLILSLFIATLLDKIKAVKKIFQTVFFLPYVLSGVAVATMWKWMFDTNFGIVNDMLNRLGIESVEWLTSESHFMISMIIITVWSGMSTNIIFFLSALSNVNEGMYEAAEIDGAGPIRKFFTITLPMISPTTFYLLITGFIGTLQSFAIFQIMGGTTAGPNESGLTVVYYLYNMAFRDTISYGMGYASATAWVLGFVIILLTIGNFILSKKWVYSND